MARPIKRRRVCSLPDNKRFGPLNIPGELREFITLRIDEYEALRLIDYEGLTQEECAKQMAVARTTIQGIYIAARKKISMLFVEGKTIIIEGGEYHLCDEYGPGCGRGCRHRHRRKNN